MNKIFLVTFLLLTFSVQSQKRSNPQTFAKTITADDLKKHLYIIASKEMEGRETATAGQRKAAAYIEGEFKRIGLLPGNNGSYQYQYPVYQDSLASALVEVNGQRFDLDKDFNVVVNTSTQARQAFSEVVYIPQNVPTDSIKAGSLLGKLVLMPAEGGMGRGMSARFYAILNAAPAAILYIDKGYPRKNVASRNGSQTLSSFKKAIYPQQLSVSENIAKAIVGPGYPNETSGASPAIIQSRVLVDVQKVTKNLQSSNVIGILPGSDLKDEYLYITAHYDHLGKRDTVIYYGADDDGSGTVSVIEMAEAWAKAKAAGKGPRRNIIFMTVSGEEKGLLGSEYYTDHPLYPLNKTTADLNIDMIGRSDPDRKAGDSVNYVYVVGDDKLSSELKPISEGLNKKYTKLELDYKYNDPADRQRIYYRSDHFNFAKNGVPIIFYYDGMLRPDYHRPTDTPDKINYDLMVKRARLVFYTSWEMANRDSMIKRDIPLPVLQRSSQ